MRKANLGAKSLLVLGKSIPWVAATVVIAMLAMTAIPVAAVQEPTLILNLTIGDTAGVVDYDDGVYVLGTSTGDLYVINDVGEYANVSLGTSPIKDVRIENGYIAVVIDNEVKELAVSAGNLTPELLWTYRPWGWAVSTSVDISGDGNYVAGLSSYGSVEVIRRDGTLAASYPISFSHIAHWLDATDDMEYIAVTVEIPPYWGTNTGVELYRFDGTTLQRMWGRILVYRYETTEVRVSEDKRYVAVATSSGTLMNLLNLTNGNILWSYDAEAEQFAVDGDDNLNYVIGGTQYHPRYGPIYKYFVLKNLGTSYQMIANGTMNGSVNDLDSSPDGKYIVFGSDVGEFILLKRIDDTAVTIFDASGLSLIDTIEIGSNTLLVGGRNFIHLYSISPPTGNVTGGGWILVQVATATSSKGKSPSDGKATFGFVAHYADGAATPSGNLQYTDHAVGLIVHGNVTVLSVDKTRMTAKFSGTAKINGTGAYAYTVTVVDNRESGNIDTFAINIPAIPYMASGTLSGGNIQIHDS